MSDSDDTELLLLIPPDLFSLKEKESISSRSSVFESEIFCNCIHLPCNNDNNNIRKNIDMASSHHYHLPSRQQKEIDNINAKISQVEKNFTAIDSDISTASNRTVLSNFRTKDQTSAIFPTKYLSNNVTTSTPKNLALHTKYGKLEDDNGVLKEIDKYLEESVRPCNWNHHLNNQCREFPGNEPNESGIYPSKNIDAFISKKNKDQCSPNTLISLNDLWENQNIENFSLTTTSTQLQEEKLRRQHCEKIIQTLQSKLLEYQQKISVALQVDKAKDNAICNLQEESERIKGDLKKLEENSKETQGKMNNDNNSLLKEISDLKISKECLEKELSQALNLAAKFQDKNEVLEIKIENFTKSADEMKALYKNQLEEMELRVINAEKSEEIANIEIKKKQDILAKTQVEKEKVSKQVLSLQNQYDVLQTKVQSIEKLEQENKSLNESLFKLSRREKELSKDIDSQKIALKIHYQHQLEKVVEQKLVEFQSQLDSVEETLKLEAKDRERTIAERAIKQLEMINEKNEQEILLINEKHNEEVELYRIQLINACKRVEELEEMLNTFRSRRVDIAEKLHTVMETQWQKALEILTSPNQNVNQPKTLNTLHKDKLDGLSADSGITKPENESFSTPTTSRNKTYNQKHDDRLQAYIELLLSKSPRDLDNLNTILHLPKNDQSPNDRSKQTTTTHQSKPPWK